MKIMFSNLLYSIAMTGKFMILRKQIIHFYAKIQRTLIVTAFLCEDGVYLYR